MTEIRTPQIPVTHNLAELTVSELSSAIKRTLESGFDRVRVRGEISGFKRAGSGHLYMQLKDDAAAIKAVVWRSTAVRLGLNPEDGMEVVATGRITSYAERSEYQLVIERVELAGLGALLKLLEDRKKKLAAEGLFDAARKRPLPLLPTVIGVVTSPSGAVIRDILHRLEDRFPRHVLLWPVLVQGEGAAQQVANAIRGFNALPAGGKVPRPDVLIVARGGGSLEDLMAFNEEIVVRAAAASEIPLISAVGHETDTTLIDFASDRRAPTPTAAAEMAVPVRADLIAEVAQCGHRLARAASRQIAEQRLTIEGLGRGLPDPVRLIQEKTQQLDAWIERRDNAQRGFFDRKRDQLHALSNRLRTPRDQIAAMRNALSSAISHLSTCISASLERSARRLDNAGAHLRPKLLRDLVDRRGDALAGCAALLEFYSYEHVLKRGFALVRDEDDQPLTSAAALSSGMAVSLQFHDGRARALVDGGSAAPKRKAAKPEKQGDVAVRMLLAVVLMLMPLHAASAVEVTGHLAQGGLVTGRTQPGAKVLLGDRAVLVGKDGLFVFGFGRDQAPNAQLTIIQPDGATEQQTLAVEQRKFDIQRIDNMEQSKVTPNPADLARIKSDQEKINAVRGDATPAEDFLVPFIWPAQGPISGVYGSQRILNGEPRAPHYGLDIAAPEGSPVIAPAPGTVRLVASDFFLTGGTVIIDHGFGVQSVFIHMIAVKAKVGTHVQQGELIGHVGQTGRATGPHLHWGMNWLDVRLDPAFWVPPQQAQN